MNNGQTILKTYTNATEALYAHVGFTPDWVMCPIDDCSEFYWTVYESDKEIVYSESKEDMENYVNGLEYDENTIYQDAIYTQRFYQKHVYRGANLTMIFADPGVDGVRWFKVFDNEKEINQND